MSEVVLNGFLMDICCPSEHKLEVEVDVSSVPWQEYNRLVEELQDLLGKIDANYYVRPWLSEGRSLKGRFKKVSADKRKRVLRFSPFPSKFKNVLAIARTYVYAAVNEYCVPLSKDGSRKLYLLPKLLAPRFIEFIERFNVDVVDKLNREIDEFKRCKEFLEVKKCLRRHGVDPKVLDSKDFHVSRFSLHLVPVDFKYSVDMDETLRKIGVEELEKIRKYVEEKNRKYVETMISEVASRIIRIAGNSKWKKKKKLVEKICEMMDMCSSIGLETVNEKILKPLREIFSSYRYKRSELSKKFFGTENLKEGVEKKLRKLRLL